MSVTGLLDIGKKGIFAHQTSITVAGHNIANVNTKGYSRQEAVLSTSNPELTRAGIIGRGVEVETVRRDYDRFIEDRLTQESSNYGQVDMKDFLLQKVEFLLNDSTGVGLGSDINSFFNAMQDLANNPSGSAERVAVKSRGEILAASFNKLSDNLKGIRDDADGEVSVLVEEINSITSRIAQLNGIIQNLESGGKTANDFRDERTILMRDLAERVGINYYEADDGTVSITGKGGFVLVQQDRSYDLATSINTSNDGHLDVVSVGAAGSTVNITGYISNGKLGAVLEVRDSDVPAYLARVDRLAYSIVTEVNNLHQSGYALDGTTTGLDFFADLSGLTSPPENAAENMAVSSDVSDVDNIAAAQSPASPGDNTNALAMAALQQTLTLGGPPPAYTFGDYYSALVADVGIDVQKVSTLRSHQETLIEQLEIRRESVSGVSLDEEMADLVKFQYAFEASAKLISIADEMLTTVIGLVDR